MLTTPPVCAAHPAVGAPHPARNPWPPAGSVHVVPRPRVSEGFPLVGARPGQPANVVLFWDNGDVDAKPIAVMDAQDLAQGGPALQHRLKWLRSEGIDPDITRRVEVYDDGTELNAIVSTLLRDQVRTGPCPRTEPHDHLEERRQEVPVRLDRVAVTSPPPTEAACYDLASRAAQR